MVRIGRIPLLIQIIFIHSSAVIVGDLKISSGLTSAGEWALASAEPRWGVTEEFYYANDEN